MKVDRGRRSNAKNIQSSNPLRAPPSIGTTDRRTFDFLHAGLVEAKNSSTYQGSIEGYTED